MSLSKRASRNFDSKTADCSSCLRPTPIGKPCRYGCLSRATLVSLIPSLAVTVSLTGLSVTETR